MDSKFVMSITKLFMVWTISFCVGFGIGMYSCNKKKYSMNLKCVQGELYEEIKNNMFVKSHLECFEQRTF
jgi:hypothetical protein